MNAELERVQNVLWGIGVDSRNRFWVMYEEFLGHKHKPEVFWCAMACGWDNSEGVTPSEQESLRKILVSRTRRDGSFANYLQEPSKSWWLSKKSEAPLVLYRGCTLWGERSLSWTLSREVAERFANHNLLRTSCSDPVVIAKTEIAWGDALFACNEREEEEVLVDYKKVSFEVERFKGSTNTPGE